MSLNIAELQDENDRLSQDNQSTDFLDNFVRMPEGNGHIVLRLLPPIPPKTFDNPKQIFYQSTRIHKVNNKSIHCINPLDPKTNRWVGECPICKYYRWLWSESERKSPAEAEAMQAQARNIKPIERYYYNVIVRKQYNKDTGNVEENVGPKIWSVGKTVHKMILRAILGDEDLDEPALGDVTDRKLGRDFKLIKVMKTSGKNSYPTYGESKFLEPSPLGTPDQIEKWTTSLHNLSSLKQVKPIDELKKQLKMHLGVIAADDSNGGFDPTEFQKGGGEDGEVRSVVREEPVSTSRVETGGGAEESESIADEDFMKQLAEM